MSDVLTESAGDERRLAEHLQRAGELLARRQARRGRARDRARACAFGRKTLRARNLRGLFLFRAARYDEALAVYLELCATYPNDAALRLNLGLVELRMGRHAEAAENLKRVVAAEPDNARAQGYLGLALMRAGELGQARDAFHRAGQEELARQVEERMAHLGEEAVAARIDLRRAANEGERILDGEQPFGAVELEVPVDEAKRGGAWQLRVPGERPPLAGARGTTARPVASSRSCCRRRCRWRRSPRRGCCARARWASRSRSPRAACWCVRVDGKLPTRTFGAIASSGQLTFEPLTRRVRGQPTDEPFGDGADAMFFAIGHGLVVVAPRGARFTALALADDIVYVRESSLFAFEESLHWENGRVPGGGPDSMRVVQFRGTGRAGGARGAGGLLAQDRARAADVRRGDDAARLDRARRAARAARAGRRADAVHRMLGRRRAHSRGAAGGVTR